MNKPLKPMLQFATEQEEQTFWESHDSTDYVDWSQARTRNNIYDINCAIQFIGNNAAIDRNIPPSSAA